MRSLADNTHLQLISSTLRGIVGGYLFYKADLQPLVSVGSPNATRISAFARRFGLLKCKFFRKEIINRQKKKRFEIAALAQMEIPLSLLTEVVASSVRVPPLNSCEDNQTGIVFSLLSE